MSKSIVKIDCVPASGFVNGANDTEISVGSEMITGVYEATISCEVDDIVRAHLDLNIAAGKFSATWEFVDVPVNPGDEISSLQSLDCEFLPNDLEACEARLASPAFAGIAEITFFPVPYNPDLRAVKSQGTEVRIGGTIVPNVRKVVLSVVPDGCWKAIIERYVLAERVADER